jgi:NAD(P)-dependent dehydrogenase (short-subunit alcohol dehydrogenase family)
MRSPRRRHPVDFNPAKLLSMDSATTNPFSLDGKTALITGGSRGIGYAIAQAFIAAGARVVITARGEDALNDAARSLGANAIAKRCDNADPADIARMVTEAWQLAPVDILVNNAGISPYYKRIEHVTVEDWDSVVDINLRGSYFCAAEVAKRMFEAQRPGSIINISSVSGVVPIERLGVYAATKAALQQLTKVMALEWADRQVRVNAIAPGWTETDFTTDLFSSRHGERLLAEVPMARLAAPSDMTGAALYLASDASSYVTGTTMVIDGGRALR